MLVPILPPTILRNRQLHFQEFKLAFYFWEGNFEAFVGNGDLGTAVMVFSRRKNGTSLS